MFCSVQVSEQLATLHAAHVAAHADVERMSAELAAAKEGHAQAEDARLAAEVCISTITDTSVSARHILYTYSCIWQRKEL